MHAREGVCISSFLMVRQGRLTGPLLACRERRLNQSSVLQSVIASFTFLKHAYVAPVSTTTDSTIIKTRASQKAKLEESKGNNNKVNLQDKHESSGSVKVTIFSTRRIVGAYLFSSPVLCRPPHLWNAPSRLFRACVGGNEGVYRLVS